MYVTMTDKALSGWGDAKNRISKIVYELPYPNQFLDKVLANAENNSDMTHVNVSEKTPRYNAKTHTVAWRTIETHPAMYR